MIAFLLLVKMDVERNIDQIEIEATVDHNFDDVKMHIKNQTIYCQMKDHDNISIDEIGKNKDKALIKGKIHKLSEEINILFIKNVEVVNNSEILGIPAYKMDNIYIISISRTEAWNMITSLYELNDQRISKIELFFETLLDERKLIVNRCDLPHIDIYSTELIDKTIKLQELILSDSNIIKIEGKPGVGKSHLVNQLELENDKILYRFWISNQDNNYRDRLNYKNFISNITKEIFQNYLPKNEEEIFDKLHKDNKVLIIDGLDHVENYNIADMDFFVDFINRAGLTCKVIVLSRPLKTVTNWETRILNNWNFDQTEKLLDEYYHITGYDIVKDIFGITNGYPILVSFLAKHYKKFNELPNIGEIKDLTDYYNNIIKNVHVKSALTLFLTSRSYFMMSEINSLLEDELAVVVKEFISSYPYLFEIRLNRISLLHDSFNTYLREQNISCENRKKIVHDKVFNSIMAGEKRYLSRFNFFELPVDRKAKIVKKYANIQVFGVLMNNCIDFEAIQSFYEQVRQVLDELGYDDLSLIEYYDLSLIYNIINRDHISTINKFLYTYVKALLYNGYSQEDITSSDFLFSMLYFVIEKDIELIKNVFSNRNYGIDNFYNELLLDVDEEESYFDKYENQLELSKEIKDALYSKREYEVKDLIEYIMVNTYIYGTSEPMYNEMYRAILIFVDQKKKELAISIIRNELRKYGVREFFAHSVLNSAKKELESSGFIRGTNDYRELSLKEYIKKYVEEGSFDVLTRIQNYLRLSLKENRKIDISSICMFWTMYHERKDYSVINIDEALKIFEIKEKINEVDSCKIIIKLQSLSEKGIRHLLKDYIEIHDISILKVLEKKFDLDDLQVNWFDLPVEYINVFTLNMFNLAINQIYRYNQGSLKVDISNVENVLISNWRDDILKKFSFQKFAIDIPDKHPLLNMLKTSGAYLHVIREGKKDNGYTSTSQERYSQGILTIADIDFIKEIGLKNYELASFTNGYHSLLSNTDIYSIYTKESMQQEIFKIIYNAFLGKIKSINMYGNLYRLVGNIPKLLYLYDIDVDWDAMYSSFRLFLCLSLIGDVK